MTGQRAAAAVMAQVRLALRGGRAGSPAARRALGRVANATGVAATLLQVLRGGSVLDAHLAALALAHARAQLVRRALCRLAAETRGERRAAVLAALTDAELQRVLRPGEKTAVTDLVGVSALVAADNAREFVEVLCSGRSAVDEHVVAHVEQVRASLGLGAASLFGPLLERRLTRGARRRVVEILGRLPGPAVARLLAADPSGPLRDDEKRQLRRERLRQASAGLQHRPQPREGVALLSVPGHDGRIVLQLFERTPSGGLLHATLVWGGASRAGGARVCSPSSLDLADAVAAAEARSPAARLTRAQARAVLEALPARARALAAPELERLEDVAPDPLVAPAPGARPDESAVRALLAQPLWRHWHPLEPLVEASPELEAAAAALPPERYPAEEGALRACAGDELARLLGSRTTAARIASALRHMAQLMALRGEPGAGEVAGEALWAARRRPGALLLALAERDLRQRLRLQAPLPPAWRAAVRARLQKLPALRGATVAHPGLLDLTQAAVEAMERSRPTAGLSAPGDVPAEAALALAECTVRLLEDPPLRRGAGHGRLRPLADLLSAEMPGYMPRAAFLLFAGDAAACLAARSRSLGAVASTGAPSDLRLQGGPEDMRGSRRRG